jgi:hypothetical protein
MSSSNDLINFISTITLYSPIIIIWSVIFFSIVIKESKKGFIYFLIVFIGIVCRIFIFSMVPQEFKNKLSNKELPGICNNFVFIVKENMLLSMFVMSFTFLYMFIPMIMSNKFNLGFIIFFLLYAIFDIGYKYLTKCYDTPETFIKFLMIDLAMGSVLSFTTLAILYAFGGFNLLFFYSEKNKEIKNDIVPEEEMKCDIYKNGKIISSI